MAKIRDLKKDVNYLTSELISQAFFVQYLYPETKEEKLAGIIEKAVLLRNNTVKSINNMDETLKAKDFFRDLQKKYIKDIFALFDELNKLKK